MFVNNVNSYMFFYVQLSYLKTYRYTDSRKIPARAKINKLNTMYVIYQTKKVNKCCISMKGIESHMGTANLA